MKEVKIRQRKDNSFEGRITIDGKQKSVYGSSNSEVKRKIKELQSEIAKGNIIVRSARLNIAIESYLFDIKQSRVKATTFDRAESTFKYHIKDESLGRMQLGTVTPQDIQKLLSEKCQKGLSESSIKKIYNLLSEFFRYATVMREISHNPMELVKLPHRSKMIYQTKEMEILTLDEVKRIIAIAEYTDKDGNLDYRYGEAIVLLLLTGMRAGEARGVNKSDIDFEKGILYVRQNVTYAKDREKGGIKHIIGDTKTEKSNREIPLNDRAVLAIKRLIEITCNHDTGYLLCTSKGQIVTHSNLAKCYTAMLKKADIAHMGLHSTRHTFATMILKQAEDKGQIKEVSELLGHSQVSTTYKYYIKTSNEDKRNLLNQLNKLAI